MGKKMANAPVYFTIGQVQHNPLLNLAEYLPLISDRMRKAGYPDFKRALQMQFELSPASAKSDGDQSTQPVVQKVERFLFSNAESTSGFVLQASSLSLQVTEYDTFEAFMQQLKLGLDILSDTVGGLSFVERIGLRYLDAVAPAVSSESLTQYLAVELLGLHVRMPDEMFEYSFTESLFISKGVGQVVSRTITKNGALGFPPDLQPDTLKLSDRFRTIAGEHAIVDTDGSFTERHAYDKARIELKLMALHELIEKSFHATVTDHARAAWGATEE